MRFDILKEILVDGVLTVQNVISSKTTLPILSNILVETQKDSIRLIATDLDIGISSIVPAEIKEEGSITIPAKRFADIVRELPNEEVSISAMKNNFLTVNCGKAFFKIMGLPKEDFPKLPEFKEALHITLEQKTLKEMLNLTNFAMSHDETRYVLNGTLFLFKDKTITLVATDGKRLAFIKKEFPGMESFNRELIIPLKTISELNRLLKEEGMLRASFTENQVLFELNGTSIISRLIEGEFPNYQQVIPKEQKEKIRINRENLLLATKRAALFTTQDSQSIKLEVFKGKLVISKNSPNIGEAREEVDIDYKGPELVVGFNPAYLLEPLKALGLDEIEFELVSSDKPGVIRTGGYLYLVLPMQLA